MEMRIVTKIKKITSGELKEIATGQFGDFIKAVVDVEQEIMIVGSELHADGEALLLERGSRQEDIWGVNLYPEKSGEERIAFSSMINIRPSQGNHSRGVEDPARRMRIIAVVRELWV